MEPSLRVASLSEDVYRFRSNYVRCSYFLGTWVVGRRSLLSLRGTANSLYLSYHTEKGPDGLPLEVLFPLQKRAPMKRGDAVPMLLGTKKLCFYFIITVHGMCWVPPCPQGRHIPSLLVISKGAFMVEGEPERGPYKK